MINKLWQIRAIFQTLLAMHPVPAGVLKLGFFLAALYTSSLYIFLDAQLPCDPTGALLTYELGARGLLCGLALLCGGVTALDVLFQRNT